jgi:hypothetical protein
MTANLDRHHTRAHHARRAREEYATEGKPSGVITREGWPKGIPANIDRKFASVLLVDAKLCRKGQNESETGTYPATVVSIAAYEEPGWLGHECIEQ